MEIVSLTESIIEYLLISSALLFILGLLSLASIRSLKIQGKAKLWICTLIVILPLAYPLKTFFPEAIKIQVPLESDYFQPYYKIITEKTIDPDAFFISNDRVPGYEINEALIGNNISNPGIKESFKKNLSVLISNWKLIVSLLWGGAFFFFLTRIIITGNKASMFLRLADPVKNPKILKLLQQCVSETGLRLTPRLLKIEEIPSPMVIGFFNPGIIIPGHLMKPEYQEGLRFTLLHELKHLQQHHNWWLLIESLIGAAYFFHPVFHWAKRKIHEELENICDRHVTHVTDKSISYADFLLNQIWQQSSGRTPALALPFFSTVSKTTNRIHSILENTGPTTFTQIRDSVSALMILMAFPLVLLLSITPSAQRPDQTLNMLNPLKINSMENVEIKSEPVKPKKEIAFFEKSSTNSTDEGSSHISKIVPAIKTVESIPPPIKTVQEEIKIEPVQKIESRPVTIVDGDNKAEVILENSVQNSIPGFDTLSGVTGSNVLWAQSRPDTVKISDESISSLNLAEKYLGTPVNELSISRIDNIRVLDEYTVLFIMRGGNIYLTRLSVPCPSLLHATDFNLGSNLGKLSKYDRIQAISFGQIMGTTGMLGPIYPYKHEGNKYDAIKLLKKSLLTALVSEGAFKESD